MKQSDAMIDFEKIQRHILMRLEDELPGYLTYHNIKHTLDVLKQTVIIAGEEGVRSAQNMLLLKVSALYHDTGFISAYTGHEEKSCEIATQELFQFGLRGDQISAICGMIRATKIPQNPQTNLEKIICDADLDYLGRIDFYTIGEGLYKEFLIQRIVTNELEWNQLQINFLEKHVYFTKTCHAKREELKQQHLKEVKRKVALTG